MKLRMRKTTTLQMLLMGLGLLFVVALVLYGVIASRAAQAQAQSGRLITVHDRGQETSFLTEEETLGAALQAAGIAVTERDAVEPGLDEKLVASDYQVNVYRSRPVTVVDGSTRQKVITPYQTAERIAQDAGITLYPEDIATLKQSSNLLEGAGLEMRIDRAQLVTFDLYGSIAEIRTQAETVGQLLIEKDIDLSSNGRTSPDRDTRVTAGMTIRVWREGTQTVSMEEAVPFEVERIEDADREVGYRSVQTPGKDGKRSVSYAITTINGIEADRTEIGSIMLEEPTKQVEVIGTKPAHLPYTGGGTKTEWLAASNIPEESWGYADYMVTRESSWNPNAVNRSSGACGLAQALPCSKVGPDPFNPVVSLNWMNNYVNGRYGGWANAYAFWTKNHWY